MGRLINFEFRKLFRHKSFYVCLIVSAALIVATIVGSSAISDLFGEKTVIEWTGCLSSFHGNAMLSLMLAIFTALFVSEDAAGGTIKNIYSRGYSRSQIYFSKYIVSSISVLIFCAVDMIVSVVCAMVMGGKAGEITAMFVPDLAGAVILLLVLNTLYFIISILLGKSGVGIAINIVVPTLIGTLLPLADMALHLEKISLSDYWIETLLTNASQAADMGALTKSIGLGIVWAIVLTVAGVLINSRQEV